MTTHGGLSSRERQVLAFYAAGFTYPQIARRMGIATSTVDTYLRRVRVKSGASSSAELVRLALAIETDENGQPGDGTSRPALHRYLTGQHLVHRPRRVEAADRTGSDNSDDAVVSHSGKISSAADHREDRLPEPHADRN